MKPTFLKAPGAKRLKLKYDEVLSNFAFNFNLRRYTTYDDQDSSVVSKVLHCPEQMHRLCNSVSEGSSRNTAKHINFEVWRCKLNQ